MKIPIAAISLVSVILALPCGADEPANPFVKKAESKKALPPPGAAFASLLENVLVPPDLLDDWLREHPIKDDATELRAATQRWIVEGKAQLEHTSLSLGTAGSASSDESVLELCYPTEYQATTAGTWPLPSAFDTRNTGYTFESGVMPADGPTALWAGIEIVEMLSSKSWDPLVEHTREPYDIFIPTFRASRISQAPPGTADASEPSNDPFAEPAAKPGRNPELVFQSGVVHLAGRLDSTSPGEPNKRLSRLVFCKGTVAEGGPAKAAAKLPEVSHISFRTIRASKLLFSTWVQGQNLLTATTGAWEAVEGWQREGKAEIVSELSAASREGAESILENVTEIIYPTEWALVDVNLASEKTPGEKPEDKANKPSSEPLHAAMNSGLGVSSRPTSFDTRNTGTTINATISKEGNELVVRYKFERVNHLGELVYRRLQVDGKWIPDVRMALFSSSRMNSQARVQPGQWTLAGASSEFLPTAKIDSEHCLLVFVKAE